MTEGKIQIYVACLAAYNNGYLHGRWINANQDAWAIYDEIRAMLDGSPIVDAEEWTIHGYEGFESVSISEHEGIERVAELAEFIAEYGALGGKLLEYYHQLADVKKAIGEQYAGEYESLSDFAQEITEQSATIPGNLVHYIDYEKMAHDLEINDVLAIKTRFDQVHVFWAF